MYQFHMYRPCLHTLSRGSVIVKYWTFVPSSGWHPDTGHTSHTVILLSLHSGRFRHNICFQQGEGASVYSSEYRCQNPWQAACEIPQVAPSQLSRYDLSSWEEVPISVLRKILYSVHKWRFISDFIPLLNGIQTISFISGDQLRSCLILFQTPICELCRSFFKYYFSYRNAGGTPLTLDVTKLSRDNKNAASHLLCSAFIVFIPLDPENGKISIHSINFSVVRSSGGRFLVKCRYYWGF